MPQLTKNFHSDEICKTVAYSSLNARSQSMVKAIAELLQQIRDKVGKPVVVNSGVRSIADYERLKKQGLNPSATSDHFFGQTVPLTPGTSAYSKYGSTHSLSTGACDIVCPSIDTVEFFNIILEMRYKGEIKTGQLLLEKNNTYWVHIANNPDLFLNAQQKALRGEWSLYGIGYSLDNGNNFHTLSWGSFYGNFSAAYGTALAVARENPATVSVAGIIAITGFGIGLYLLLRPKKQTKKLNGRKKYDKIHFRQK